MQLTIPKSTLLRELTALQGIAERKNTIPILGNIHINANGNLTLRATDLDVAFQTGCAADIAKPGQLCVNAKKLTEIVKSLPEADIKFELIGKGDKSRVNITCERAKFSMAYLPADQFPELPAHDGAYIALSGALLRTLIQRTQFAICAEESRYALNGARFELTGGPSNANHIGDKIRMVATDGHRLALAEAFLPDESNGIDTETKWEILIPRKTLAEISKLADGAEMIELAMAANGQHIFARAGSRWLASRLLTGQFPAYQGIIPDNPPHKAVVDVQALGLAVRRVSLMADERSRAIQLAFSENQITVNAPASELGDAGETVTAGYAGPEMVLAVNAGYVADFLGACPTKEVSIELSGPDAVVTMRPVGDVGILATGLLMPMRT